MKSQLGVLAIFLMLFSACAGGEGKTESSSFTEPSFPEAIVAEPEIIVVEVEVPAQDNRTVYSGKLAQGYVKGATVIADLIRTDTQSGNLQQDPGEVTAVSDVDGSYTLSSSYANFVFFSRGGTVTNANGQEVPALPMLAPMPEAAGQEAVNITPLTTLVTTQPALKEVLDELGGWNSDIAQPTGVPGSLLRVAKTVETVLQILGGGQDPLLNTTTALLLGTEKIAATMAEAGELRSDNALSEVAATAATDILNDPNLIAPSRLAQAGSVDQILAGIQNSIQVVTTTIEDTADPVVEAEVIATIEESVAGTVNEVDQLIGNSVEIGLTFTPVIEDLQVLRTGETELTLTAIVSDDRPLTELRYQWTMEGQTFSSLTSNPTQLLGYNDNLTGSITLRITDENGSGRSTLLTRPLSIGEFPYSLP